VKFKPGILMSVTVTVQVPFDRTSSDVGMSNVFHVKKSPERVAFCARELVPPPKIPPKATTGGGMRSRRVQ
jgi:hypothetical protein